MGIAPAEQKDVEVEWHGRTIKGRVYMRDLLDIASKGQALPPINTADTDHDFAVFISNRPCGDKVTELAKRVGDPRILFWTPGPTDRAGEGPAARLRRLPGTRQGPPAARIPRMPRKSSTGSPTG